MIDADRDELDDRVRAAVEALPVVPPSADFAERVVAARGSAAPTVVATDVPVAASGRGRTLTTASIVVAGACVVALGIAVVRTGVGSPAGSATGEVELTAWRSVALGARAVAVAEAGAALSWRVDAAGADITQRAGDVFYRVERGGAFVVHTPAGDVRVTGTCFRVEVPDMMMKKHELIGGVVGAAVAAAVVVSVYEGGVVVANQHGSQSAAAGDRIVVGAGAGPGFDRGGAGGLTDTPAGELAREALLAQNAAQRQQLAGLTAEIARLREDGIGDGPGGAGQRLAGRGADDGDGRPWFDPSAALLAQMAKECAVRFDMPPMMETEPFSIPARRADDLGLAPAELAAVNAALAAVHRDWTSRVRALYLEVTGDATGADTLSPQALAQEIQDKSPPGEADTIRRRIAAERAGLATPPADLTGTSAIERYLRLLAGVGDRAEQAIAAKIGAARARELRSSEQGIFGFRMEMAGCPGDDEGGHGGEAVETTR